MSEPQPCPECEAETDDSLFHYITDHPGRPVLCSECYRPFTDPVEHHQTFHVPSIFVTIGGRDVEIERVESGEFLCPWCVESYLMAGPFKDHAQDCGSFKFKLTPKDDTMWEFCKVAKDTPAEDRAEEGD